SSRLVQASIMVSMFTTMSVALCSPNARKKTSYHYKLCVLGFIRPLRKLVVFGVIQQSLISLLTVHLHWVPELYLGVLPSLFPRVRRI
ncbi:hypothetical protein EDC04DRAFT_2642170, partial [Pisolithus marmoratus]